MICSLSHFFKNNNNKLLREHTSALSERLIEKEEMRASLTLQVAHLTRDMEEKEKQIEVWIHFNNV